MLLADDEVSTVTDLCNWSTLDNQNNRPLSGNGSRCPNHTVLLAKQVCVKKVRNPILDATR